MTLCLSIWMAFTTGALAPHGPEVTLTVTGALTRTLLDTTSWTTYSPATSARNDAVAPCSSTSTAVLPSGRVTKDQEKASG